MVQMPKVVEDNSIQFGSYSPISTDRDMKVHLEILNKYNFPIIRFRTNESDEKEKLISKLNELQTTNVSLQKGNYANLKTQKNI